MRKEKPLTADEEMEDGFGGIEATQVDTGGREVVPVDGATPAAASADGATPAAASDETTPVQLTKEQFDALLEAADLTKKNKEQIDKLFGTTGTITKTLKERPAVSADGQGLSPEDIGRLVGETAGDVLKQSQIDTLDETHPTWRDDVGAVKPGEKADPEHPFRKWLDKQPDKDRILNTYSATLLGRAIDRFKAETVSTTQEITPPPSKPAAPAKPGAGATPQVRKTARPNRFSNATTPRTSGSPPAPKVKNADEELMEGFNEA